MVNNTLPKRSSEDSMNSCEYRSHAKNRTLGGWNILSYVL